MKVLKFFRSRGFISLVFFVIASVIAFVALPKAYEDKAVTTNIIVAKNDIKKGTEITNDMLQTKEVGSYGLNENIIVDENLLVGQYSTVDILQEDFFVQEKLTKFVVNEKADEIMRNNQRVITLTLPSVASGVASHLQSGDIVSIANFDEIAYANNLTSVVIDEKLKEIEVLTIENSNTENIDYVKSEVDTNSSKYDPIPSTVTLIVTEEQAKLLIEIEKTGNLHLLLVRRDI